MSRTTQPPRCDRAATPTRRHPWHAVACALLLLTSACTAEDDDPPPDMCDEAPDEAAEALCRSGATQTPSDAVDPDEWPRIVTFARASVAAYASSGPTPCPSAAAVGDIGGGYVYQTCWSGLGRWPTTQMETFGLLFERPATATEPRRLLFAFRGTDTLDDVIADLISVVGTDWPRVNPVPGEDPGRVGDGFFWVYAGTESDPAPSRFEPVDCEGAVEARSMRTQVRCLLARYVGPGAEDTAIEITGHSLGGALATLFAADLGDDPTYGPMVDRNINIASPVVGDSAFAAYYDDILGLHPHTLRVANAYDIVPCLPPPVPPYGRHVGQVHHLAFASDRFVGFVVELASCAAESDWQQRSACVGTALAAGYEVILTDHASANYAAVLACAAEAPDHVCWRGPWDTGAGTDPIDSSAYWSLTVCDLIAAALLR